MADAPWSNGSITPLFIEGYPDQLSYAPGETCSLHVSTSSPSFSIKVAPTSCPPAPAALSSAGGPGAQVERIGVKREEVLSESELRGSLHPVPETAASHGCGWPAAHSFTVPESWRSGFYEVTLSVEDGGGTFTHRGKRTAESVLSFVVRAAAPGSASKVLLQLSTNSYAAYNNWGGFSVYGYHGINGVQGHRASFERPMGTGLYYSWEHFFVVWAEGNGETAFATHTHTRTHHPPPTRHHHHPNFLFSLPPVTAPPRRCSRPP